MGRTMINEYDLPKYFWAEAVNTACYISNRVLIRKQLNKTHFDLIYQKTPRLSYFKVFGCVCHILNTKDHLEKFQSKFYSFVQLHHCVEVFVQLKIDG